MRTALTLFLALAAQMAAATPARDEAVALVKRTVRGQSIEDWSRAYEATGSDDRTRFAIVLRCLAHFEHHLGQIIYLVKEQDPRQR